MTTKIYQKFPTRKLLILTGLAVAFLVSGCQKEITEDPNRPSTIEDTEAIYKSLHSELTQMVYGMQEELAQNPMEIRFYGAVGKAPSPEGNAYVAALADEFGSLKKTSSMMGPNKGSKSATYLTAGHPADYFGNSIAKKGNTLFIGAPGDNQVHLFKNGMLEQSLSPVNGAMDFGIFVAASNNWLAVASGTDPFTGQVHLFKKSGNSWDAAGTINPEIEYFGGATGTDMAMDGNQLVIMGRDGTQGKIKVYVLTGNTWTFTDELSEPEVFWWDVDISANTIVANGGSTKGFGIIFEPRVYIYEKTGPLFSLTTEVPFPEGYILARSVAMENSTIVANTYLEQNKSVVITPSGEGWSVEDELIQPLPMPMVETRKLALQGSRIVVTVPTVGDGPIDEAHVFEKTGGSWVLTETLSENITGIDYLFGQSVLVSGNEIILGAPSTIGDSGIVIIFE